MFELKKIVFEVLTEPVPLARPRFARGRMYLPQKSRDYRKILQKAARSAMDNFKPLTGALFCHLNFYRKFKATSRNYGDLDNHVKAVFDALNGICYGDDAQIVRFSAAKNTDKVEPPRIEVEIGVVGFEQVQLPLIVGGVASCAGICRVHRLIGA